MKSIIVEDEPRDLEVLQKAIGMYCRDVEIVATASSIAGALKVVRETRADLLFLDIELPDGRAFDLLEQIKDVPLKIIFITAHSGYAVKAFRFCAIDYLLKPVNFSELVEAVRKAKEGISIEVEKRKIELLLEQRWTLDKIKKIAIPERKGTKFIDTGKIICIGAEGSYSSLTLTGGQELVSTKGLKEYEDMLCDGCFVRVSRSHIVNINHVNELKSGGEILLTGGLEVQIGRQFRDSFLARMKVCRK
ncbi:MAG: response regulator transcription factor [Bacteroidales bacterium]|nr:response regulator transcription factor [Bacteroidales bacterium]